MKLIFEGTPEQVLREMKEYVARASLEFGEIEEDDPPTHTVSEKVTRVEPAHVVSAPEPEVATMGKPETQNSDERACQFCVSYIGKGGHLKNHERYCRKNPNREPHPKDGKPQNPVMKAALKKYWNDKKALKGVSGSDQLESESPPPELPKDLSGITLED